MNGQKNLKDWVMDNLMGIIVYAITIILAWAYLQSNVLANTKDIERLNEIVSQYPSEDFFEEKFKNIDGSINDVKGQIRDVKSDLTDLEKKVDALPQKIQ